jgi:hypothetical protein
MSIDSPYNTYLHPGLPPGPVNSPGLASIRAALYPAQVPYLFFVARPDGYHIFAGNSLLGFDFQLTGGTLGAMLTGVFATNEVNDGLKDAAGKPLLIESTVVSIFVNRLIAYDIKFTAAEKPATFGDTKEGMFGIRVADTLREKAGGKVVNAEGRQGTAECWGQESKWVDYIGDVGGKSYGVTLIDHPQNFRKSRFHVRDYGLFTLSPFGQSAYTNGQLPPNPLVLEAGKSIRLRYGLFIHPGDTDQAQVPSTYDFYVKNAGD